VLLLQVEGVLGKWNIKDKTVAFVTDWGSNMVKAGECLQEMLPQMMMMMRAQPHDQHTCAQAAVHLLQPEGAQP
jgi:hypothetical protein